MDYLRTYNLKPLPYPEMSESHSLVYSHCLIHGVSPLSQHVVQHENFALQPTVADAVARIRLRRKLPAGCLVNGSRGWEIPGSMRLLQSVKCKMARYNMPLVLSRISGFRGAWSIPHTKA
jgi:hypothetical protein